MERLSCPASTGQSRDWTASLRHAKPLLSPASQALSKGLGHEADGGSQSLISSILLMLHKGPKLLKEAQDQTIRLELIRFNARNKPCKQQFKETPAEI